MQKFTEFPGSLVKEHFPSFYHRDDAYFEIVKGEQPIGFISISPFLDNLSCNYAIFMYEKYKLTKNIIINSFKLPKQLGYKKMFLYSDNPIVINFLDYMNKFDIKYVCNMFGNRYYVKYLED